MTHRRRFNVCATPTKEKTVPKVLEERGGHLPHRSYIAGVVTELEALRYGPDIWWLEQASPAGADALRADPERDRAAAVAIRDGGDQVVVELDSGGTVRGSRGSRRSYGPCRRGTLW